MRRLAVFLGLTLFSASALFSAEAPKFAPPRILEEPIPEAAAKPAPDVLFFGPERIFPKDPHAAFCFSLLCPGLGHVYSESYTRGVLAFGVFAVGAGALINNGRLVHDPQSMSDLKMRNSTAFHVAAPLVLAWYLFTAQDARSQARRYNKKLGFRFAVTARGPAVDLRF